MSWTIRLTIAPDNPRNRAAHHGRGEVPASAALLQKDRREAIAYLLSVLDGSRRLVPVEGVDGRDAHDSLMEKFYKANGFEEVGRGDTLLASGRPIACVFMRSLSAFVIRPCCL